MQVNRCNIWRQYVLPSMEYFWSPYSKCLCRSEETEGLATVLCGIFRFYSRMDSPLWGVIRLYWHHTTLWTGGPGGSHVPTNNFWDWVLYYYNPFGHYLVWDSPWPFAPYPTAWLIFWSLIIRVLFAVLLIFWQRGQEKDEQMWKKQRVSLGIRGDEWEVFREQGFREWIAELLRLSKK